MGAGFPVTRHAGARVAAQRATFIKHPWRWLGGIRRNPTCIGGLTGVHFSLAHLWHNQWSPGRLVVLSSMQLPYPASLDVPHDSQVRKTARQTVPFPEMLGLALAYKAALAIPFLSQFS
jgi:hypothetical protein